jgi:hypothetical protein
MTGQIHTNVPVVFEDVRFHRATNIPKEGLCNVTVSPYVCMYVLIFFTLPLICVAVPAPLYSSETMSVKARDKNRFMAEICEKLFNCYSIHDVMAL